MKTIVITALTGLISLSVAAQKVVEKNLEYSGRQINLDVKFASDIEVRSWDKNEVYFKADITIEDGKYLDLYEVNIDESDSRIDIESDVTDVFKAFRKEYDATHNDKDCNFCCNLDFTFNYVLYIPKNAGCKVSSINGHLRSDLIDGSFTADLINGDIDIKEYKGDLSLKTINGAIDLKLLNTSLTAETLHGNIYADEKLELSFEDKFIGQKVEASTQNAINRLRLNTINGNVYLRL